MRLSRAGAALDGQRLGQPLLLLWQALLHALQLRQLPVGAVKELPGARALRARHSTVSLSAYTGQCALSGAREWSAEGLTGRWRPTWESSLKGSFGCRSPYLRRSCGQLPLVDGAEQVAELVSISLRQAVPISM